MDDKIRSWLLGIKEKVMFQPGGFVKSIAGVELDKKNIPKSLYEVNEALPPNQKIFDVTLLFYVDSKMLRDVLSVHSVDRAKYLREKKITDIMNSSKRYHEFLLENTLYSSTDSPLTYELLHGMWERFTEQVRREA